MRPGILSIHRDGNERTACPSHFASILLIHIFISPLIDVPGDEIMMVHMHDVGSRISFSRPTSVWIQ